MRLKLYLLLLAISAVALRADLTVVATTPDLGAIAREIGGRDIKLTVLGRPTEDPHFVEPKPSFLVQLNRADVLIEGGAELEKGWLGALVRQARNSKLLPGARGHLAGAEGVELVEIPAALDRSHGDIHASGNPHYLVDPENAKIVARNITAKFCELDPDACQKYQANLRNFTTRLDAALKEWTELMAPHKGERIAAYHNSWPYFGRRFGLKIDLFLEPKPGIPPTPASLSSVIDEMKRDQVKVIICDVYLNHKTAEKVATETGARVVETSHFPGAFKNVEDDYISFIDHLVKSMAAALNK